MRSKQTTRKNLADPEGKYTSPWLEQLENSTTLKVKFKGRLYPVPPPIFRQARKFALQSVGIDYDIFRNNPSSDKTKEKEVKKAFEQFLESYLESIVPDTKSNPSAKKIEVVYDVWKTLIDPELDNGIIKTWFPNKTPLERKHLSSALKGAIMTLSHLYIEGNMKITKKDFGFPEDATPSQQEDVNYNRLLRAMVGNLVANLVAKFYSINGKEFNNKIRAAVPSHEIAKFWRDNEIKTAFFEKKREDAINLLSPIDLLNGIKKENV